ncbi:unnamed protein product [Calypogeia fissa]
MQAQAAEKADAPLGFSMMIATKAKAGDKARLKGQEEVQAIEALQREKIEWEAEKVCLANDFILERSIASKAVVETADLKKLVEKERSTITNQARLILSQGNQLNQRDTVIIVQRDNEIKLLLLENTNLRDTMKGLESDNIAAEHERDEAMLDVSNANDKEEALTTRIKELKDQIKALTTTSLPNKCQVNV